MNDALGKSIFGAKIQKKYWNTLKSKFHNQYKQNLEQK